MRNSRPIPGAFSYMCAVIALAFGLGVTATSVSAQASGTIRGRVTAEGSLRPLVGAQVTVQSTSRGALTNQNGDFVITNVPAGSHVVQAQMIGFGSEEMPAAVPAGGAAQLDFTLAQQALALDEVVVTGQAGQARRREVGNSISQINMANVIEPIQTAESLLQGRAPGVRVTFTDASVGSGAAIRLRGSVSASQSNQPLIYVDGVRQSADSYRAGGNSKAASPLADINPNDIDRIEIIKGAAAATLYGSEAAAGVIQIFTKRGSDGDPRFTYHLSDRPVCRLGAGMGIGAASEAEPRPVASHRIRPDASALGYRRRSVDSLLRLRELHQS
jgi:TonB-dependent starch-binding outer membrane protein SusC